MRIGIEAHMIGRRRTGNERVVVNLVKALREISDHELILYFTDRDAAGEWRGSADRGVGVRVQPLRNPIARRALTMPIATHRDDLDVLLAHYSRPILSSCPVVTIVHDVSFERHPEFLSRYERLYMYRTIPWSIRHSYAVVTGSQFSRDEMLSLYGERRIVVAPYGVEPKFGDPAPAEASMPRPYFVAIGNLEPRKNLLGLLRGYRRLVEEHPSVPEKLLVVGQEKLMADEIYREAEDLRRSGRVVFTGFVDDAALVALLHNATGFAYPSHYEGFGLPCLEAMAAGCPVVAADIPVLREVVGEAGMYAPPNDAQAWADALFALSATPTLREQLIAAGQSRVAAYTWENTARIVLPVLESAALSA